MTLIVMAWQKLYSITSGGVKLGLWETTVQTYIISTKGDNYVIQACNCQSYIKCQTLKLMFIVYILIKYK